MYLLHTYPDRFVVDVDGAMSAHQHGGEGASTDSLVIDRATGAMSRSKGPQRPPHGAAYSERIDGLVGIIQSGGAHTQSRRGRWGESRECERSERW